MRRVSESKDMKSALKLLSEKEVEWYVNKSYNLFHPFSSIVLTICLIKSKPAKVLFDGSINCSDFLLSVKQGLVITVTILHHASFNLTCISYVLRLT